MCHHCAKDIRQFLRGWGANLGADIKAQKGALLDQIRALDHQADTGGLSPDSWMHRYSLEASLMVIFEGEELFWRRRSGQNWILRGESNTKFFHAVANGRRRRHSIPCLWAD